MLIILVVIYVAYTSQNNFTASKLRILSDEAFVKGQFDKATKLLTECIKKEPDNVQNFMKRYRIYIKVNNYNAAINDLTSVISLDPTHDIAIQKRGQLFVNIGECEKSLIDGNKINNKDLIDSSNKCLNFVKLSNDHMKQNDFKKALEYYTELSNLCPLSITIRHSKLKCLYSTKDWYGIISETSQIVKLDKNDLMSYYYRGLSHINLGEADTGMKVLRQCLQLDPEYKDCIQLSKQTKVINNIINNIQESRERNDINESVGYIDKGRSLHMDGENKRRYLRQSCFTYVYLKDEKNVLDNCQEAVNMDNRDIESIWNIGDLYMKLEDYDKAIHWYKKALEIDSNQSIVRERLQKAEAALKQSKQKDYYKILEVKRDSELSEIKKSYRNLALKWHPDKVSEELREEAVKKFQDIAEAYEVLSNEELRGKYDRGEDIQNNGGGGQGNPFQGGFPFNFGSGGGNFHFKFG